MIAIILICTAVSFIALFGYVLIKRVSWLKNREQRDHAAYKDRARKLLKSNTAGELKEVMQVMKLQYPESTRKQRQEVAALYRRQCNNS